MTTITPTRLAPHSRIANAIRRAYLRVLLASAEQDALAHEAHAIMEPILAKLARERAAELRVELAQL